jgi:hypothetical protein
VLKIMRKYLKHFLTLRLRASQEQASLPLAELDLQAIISNLDVHEMIKSFLCSFLPIEPVREALLYKTVDVMKAKKKNKILKNFWKLRTRYGKNLSPHLVVTAEYSFGGSLEMATGGQARISVTRGLLEKQRNDVINGVICHELGHSISNDRTAIKFAAYNLVAIPSFLLIAYFLWAPPNHSGLYILACAFALAGNKQFYLWTRRKSEYRADITGTRIQPRSMVQTMRTIVQLETASRRLYPISRLRRFGAWFDRTHPTSNSRLAIVEKLAAQIAAENARNNPARGVAP